MKPIIYPEMWRNVTEENIIKKFKVDDAYNGMEGYIQYEYIKDELKDLFAYADIVISRAGANAICELLALKKPNILIPLPSKSSRGDQLLNAQSFEKQGFSKVITEENLTDELLLSSIDEVYCNRDKYIDVMASSSLNNAIQIITGLIKQSK